MSNLGIPIQILDGVNTNESAVFGAVADRVIFDLKSNPKYHSELVNLLVDKELDQMLDGIEELGSTAEQDNKILKYLIKTRDLIIANPEAVKHIQNPVQMAQMFDYAIKYWNTDKRDEALAKLADLEADLIDSGNIRIDFLQGLDNDTEEWYVDEENEPELRGCNYSYSEVEGLNGEPVLVRHYQFNGLSGFWSRLKKGVKKAWHKTKRGIQKAGKSIKKVAKKTWKAIKKYNPMSVAVRNGFLLALRMNVFHMADKLAMGYLSEQQASQYGASHSDWQKSVKMLKKVEKLHTKILGGNVNSLKKAILSGKRKHLLSTHLTGVDILDGLGVAATAAGTAAASGVIAKVVSWLKELKPWKWLKKNPRKAELQAKYGRKEGRRMYREEKHRAHDNKIASGASSMFDNFTLPQQQANNFIQAGYNPAMPVNAGYMPAQSTKTPPKPKFLSKEWRVKHKKGLIIGGIIFTTLLIGGGFAVYETKKKKRKKSTTKKALNGIKKVELK